MKAGLRRLCWICPISFAIILMTHGVIFAGGTEMLKVVELKGSYYEIGKGWGEIFKDDMEKVAAAELGVIASFFGISQKAVVEMGSRYQPAAQAYDPDFMEVLRGFSEGSNTDFDTIFAIRSVLDLLCSGPPPQGMCTSLALGGKATADGQTIVGQNIDWHPGLPMALLRITWPNGVKQLSLSMAGIWEYTLSEHGTESPFTIMSTLTITADAKPEIPVVPINFIMNKASRQTRMERALSVFINAKSNMPSYLLANGDGDMIGIELGLQSCELLYPEAGVLIHANHNLSPRFAAKDGFLRFVPDSPLRYARLKRLVEENYGNITPKHVMEFLSDHHNYPKGICTHVDPKSELPPAATLASVVMEPQKGYMYVAVGNPCENEYVRYALNP